MARPCQKEQVMTVNDLTIMIAGEAGQGVESTGRGFVKAVVRLRQ